MSTKHLIVLGGGPAGVATAIGLRRIGYRVSLLHAPRQFAACEGLSPRTLQGLHRAGCGRAAATAAPLSPRLASWNGSGNQYNGEHLVARPLFDRALEADLRDAGIEPIAGRVQRVEDHDGQWRIDYRGRDSQPGTLTGDYLVEARGRSGALPSPNKLRGPETVSLLQRWRTEPNRAASLVAGYHQGWVWLARLGTTLYTQITLTANDPAIPKRGGLRQFIHEQLQQVPETASWYRGAIPVGEPIARGSTAILCGEPVTRRLLRVGDAALAADPLSGNGIFAALSLALAAPAVINTILGYPARADLAMQFYRDRCRETFLRFARTGRDFYRLEQRWPDQPFWRERRHWPDDQPLHSETDPAQTRIAERPVLAQDQIIGKNVLITPDQPLGIWQVAGVELAPVVAALKGLSPPSRDGVKAFLSAQRWSQQQRAAVLSWLDQHQCPQRSRQRQPAAACEMCASCP